MANPGHRGSRKDPTLVFERDFQATVLETAKAFGWEAFYIPDSAKAGAVGRPKGWFDMVLVHPEMCICLFVENKTDAPTSVLSPDQERWAKIMDDCGQVVQLWRPSIWDHIEAVLKGPAVLSWAALNNPDVGRWNSERKW